jgi:hypothetical protein
MHQHRIDFNGDDALRAFQQGFGECSPARADFDEQGRLRLTGSFRNAV